MTALPAHITETSQLILIGPMQCEPAILHPTLANMPQVAVDGGILAASEPAMWAGDGDSGFVPKDIPVFTKHNQDQTDLCFALETLQGGVWSAVHFFGFIGGRWDHALANFGAVHAAMKTRPAFSKAVFYDKNGRAAIWMLCAGTHKFWLNGLFSVLSLEEMRLTLGGACRFPAEDLLLPPLSGQGVSNSGSGDIELTATQPVIVTLGA